MDYEKKYKEALERARIYRDNAKAVKEYSAVARYENIFPELRESEDERVRKEIIDHLVREVGLYPGVDRKEHKWLRWLEKQKEQKPAEWSEEDKNELAIIISVIENDKADAVKQYPKCKALCDAYDRMLNFLKSLRHSWKPSEEQMEVDLKKAAMHVYESWVGGTMDDIRRDMIELGKVLNTRKEENK